MVAVKLYQKTGIQRLDADCGTGRLTASGAELSFVPSTARFWGCRCALGDTLIACELPGSSQ